MPPDLARVEMPEQPTELATSSRFDRLCGGLFAFGKTKHFLAKRPKSWFSSP
jgi:hypothetical protein